MTVVTACFKGVEVIVPFETCKVKAFVAAVVASVIATVVAVVVAVVIASFISNACLV